MIDKESYKILKMLYKQGNLSKEYIDALTGHTKKNCGNPIVSALLEDHLIAITGQGDKPDGEGGWAEGRTEYRITISGRAIIEQRQRDLWNFWAPYSITTLIAVLNLLAMVLANWDTIRLWFSACNPGS